MTGHPAYGELRPATPSAGVVVERNPNHMTLEGTNTWVLRAPGAAACVVVDPGEDDPEHRAAVLAHGPVELVLLTHHHHDHTGGVAAFVEHTGAPVRASDPGLCRDAAPLGAGEELSVAGVVLRVLATPGHTADSVSFLVTAPEPALLAGDTILGRGTAVIARPDGSLGAYLGSLRELAALAAGIPVLPGHGPDLPDAAGIAAAYLAHREERLDQVRAALAQLGAGPADATPRQVVEIVYADVDRVLWDAAEWSVRAQLDYLSVS